MFKLIQFYEQFKQWDIPVWQKTAIVVGLLAYTGVGGSGILSWLL